MARPTPLALLLAVASVLAGCDIVDLETPAATMTTTGVYVLIAENDSVVVEISAYVNAGIDVRGHARQLDDPVLVVNGRPLQPTFEHPDDYMYRTTMGSAAARDGLVFRLPRVTGFAGQPIELNVPVLHRAGGRNLQLRGGDLVLELAPAPIQMLESESQWSLDLVPVCSSNARPFIHLTGSRLPSSTLTVSRMLFDPLAPSEFEACLQVSGGISPPNAPYRVFAQVTSSTIWRVLK